MKKLDSYPVDAYLNGCAISGALQRDDEPFVVHTGITVHVRDSAGARKQIVLSIAAVKELAGLVDCVPLERAVAAESKVAELEALVAELTEANQALFGLVRAIETAPTFASAPEVAADAEPVAEPAQTEVVAEPAQPAPAKKAPARKAPAKKAPAKKPAAKPAAEPAAAADATD